MKSLLFFVLLVSWLKLSSALQGAPGGLDPSFTTGSFFDGVIDCAATQSDGKTIVGGSFTTVQGTLRNRIARLNVDGSVDAGFDPGTGADGEVQSLGVQSDGKVLIAGKFASINGISRKGIARLNADGSVDRAFDSQLGVDGPVYTILPRGDGTILIGGAFYNVDGVSRGAIAKLKPDGRVDTAFDFGTAFSLFRFPPSILSLAEQPDGKIMVGGDFVTINGITQNRIARLNRDGTLDSTFKTSGADNQVNTVILQADGKILVAGSFTSMGGTSRGNIARLNSDGTLDGSFVPAPASGTGIKAIAVQADGRILTGGDFSTIGATLRPGIARLNSGGTLDKTYNPNLPNAGIGTSVRVVTLQPDGKALITGEFATLTGFSTKRLRIMRINANGNLDINFSNFGPNAPVRTIVAQGDGTLTIGGGFTNINGANWARIAQLKSDGTLNTVFNPGTGANDLIFAIWPQPDGKLLIAGNFTAFNGSARNRIARLQANGTLDSTFNPIGVPSGSVRSLALQADGKILVGGSFGTINGATRRNLARLNANGTLDTVFTPPANNGNAVYAIASQNDGKILVGGYGLPANPARLNADGTIDSTWVTKTNGAPFDSGTGANDIVNSVAVQNDGKVLFGGNFTKFNGTSRARIARANADGSLDGGFDPGIGPNGAINSLAIETNGQILIAGSFDSVANIARNGIARLNPDGTLDAAFDPGTGAGEIYSVATQSDGKVLIVGNFWSFNGVARDWVARLFSEEPKSGPVIQKPIPDLSATVGIFFAYTFPPETFTDADPAQTLTYAATGLPDGLVFDSSTRTFSGSPSTSGSFNTDRGQ